MIRIRRGTALLNKVVKQFDQAIVDLDVAQQQIEQQRVATLTAARTLADKNIDREDQLDELIHKVAELLSRFARWYSKRNVAAEGALYEKDSELYQASLRAQTVRQNIAKLVGAA